MRYNAEIYDLCEDMKVTARIKFRQLQWSGYIMRMVEQLMAKEVLHQIIHSKRRVGKPRERWGDGVRGDGIMLLIRLIKNCEMPVSQSFACTFIQLTHGL